MSRSAPVCTFCKRSGAGVQFAIFNPRFQPFGTACSDCEALVSVPNLCKLREESVTATDWIAVDLCTRAIDGDVPALSACVHALRDARAQR